MQALQTLVSAAVRMVYPPQCLTCPEPVMDTGGLCPDCWSRTRFITGLSCDACGTPLVGDDPGEAVHCDDCLTVARPWSQGRAALVYRDNGRRLVMALKHGDRTDLVPAAAQWMGRAAAPLLVPDIVVVPVPLHWRRRLSRRYNQSALLSRALAQRFGLEHVPDLLVRTRATPSQKGRDRNHRFANLQGAIRAHRRHCAALEGRTVLLVDDVMTSGATFAAAAEACTAAGAKDVRALALARAVKET